jgi:hypothetical protein
MAIEAPISKFRKTNLKIYIGFCVALALWFAYDGYFNAGFIKKNTDANGAANGTLIFNQKSPPFFAGAAALLGAYLFALKGKKVIADDNELVLSEKKRIPYDSIQKIDKTYFAKRGFFIITYKDKSGNEVHRALSYKKYDNLGAVLDHLVAKIS